MTTFKKLKMWCPSLLKHSTLHSYDIISIERDKKLCNNSLHIPRNVC